MSRWGKIANDSLSVERRIAQLHEQSSVARCFHGAVQSLGPTCIIYTHSGRTHLSVHRLLRLRNKIHILASRVSAQKVGSSRRHRLDRNCKWCSVVRWMWDYTCRWSVQVVWFGLLSFISLCLLLFLILPQRQRVTRERGVPMRIIMDALFIVSQRSSSFFRVRENTNQWKTGTIAWWVVSVAFVWC